MNTRYSLLFLLAIISFVSVSAQVILPVRQLDTTLLVGATPGNANVSSGGAANYSIPIFVSPGTAGLQPNISIEYNSQATNGVLGAGWNIAGLSAITRVPQDFYHDGAVKGVSLTTTDKFEWDGNRITGISGGSSGTIYASESETFAYILSPNQQAGNGPASFNITTKEGIVLSYGETTDSRIEAPGSSTVLLWRLNQMKDKNGNYINYTYTELNGDSYIDKITYTGNNSISPVLVPYNELRFYYENRPDTSKYFVAGSAVTQTKRLDSIVVYSENVRVRKYVFTYLPIETGNLGYEKSRLAQIQEYGILSNTTKALNPTVINWGIDTNTISEISCSGNNPGYDTKTYFSDLNWDGRTDQLVLRKLTSGSYYTQWYYYQSNGTTLTQISSGNIEATNCDGAYIADLNNDGKNEILFKTTVTNTVIECYPCDSPSGAQQQTESTTLESDINTALEISAVEVKIADSCTMNVVQSDNPGECCDTYYYTYYRAYNYSIVNNALVRGNVENDLELPNLNVKILPGHFNSDGKTNLLILEADNNFRMVNGLTLSTYPSFNTPDKVELIDFDGDGLDEIFVLKAQAYKLFKYSNSIFSVIRDTILAGATSTNLKTGDFNGDGKTDIVLHKINGNKFSVFLSTGVTFTGPLNTALNQELDNDTVWNVEADFFVLDLNGDGRDDIMNYYSKLSWFASNYILNGSPAFIKYYSKYTGELGLYGFQKIDDTLTNKPFVIDFADIDGDGTKDAALMLHPTAWPVTPVFNGIIYKNYANPQKYRINTINNGLNQAVGFSYLSLAAANSGIYTKGKSSAFPVIDIQPAQFVVSTLTTHAGYMNAGNYVYSVTDFSYKGARSHLQGKGYLGFDTLVSVNNLSGIKTESCYGINGTYYFRYPLAVNNYVAGAAANKKTFTFTTLSKGTKRYYTYPLQDINYDLVTNTTVTHDYTFDSYGNMLTDKATYDSDAVVTTTNTYITKGGSGVPNRVSTSTVSSVYTGQPAFATQKTFTYDPKGNCLTEVDFDGQAKPVTTTYGYTANSCGLPVSVTVSASGMASRTGRTDYDTKYRLPIRTINPLGYKSKKTFDFKTGVVLSDSAANGLTTTYAYDQFGRLNSTTVPQGYAITQSMAWPKAGNPTGTIYSSTVVTPGKPTLKAYYDILGRAIRTETTGVANKTTYTDASYVPATPYGKAGLLTSQSLPYYTGETPQLVKYKYDAYGRNTEVDDRGMVTKTAYNEKTVTNTDVANRTSAKTINALGNVISATDNGGSIAYLYHSSGQPRQITAVSAVTTITYDAYGRQLTLADPDAGTTRYTYNAFGELASQTDARGNKDTLFVYDAMGRITQKSLGGDVTAYVYNNTGRATGQLASVTGANGAKQEFTYEPNYGWPATVAQTIPGQTAKFTTSYTYDIYGNNTKIVYPETGFAVTNTYDKGALIKVNRFSDNSLIWELKDVSSHGLPVQTAFGNGLLTNYGYTTDQLTQITTGAVQNETYTVTSPNIANLMYRKDNLTNQYENFSYDNLDRLAGITYMTNPLQKIFYSGNGNITRKYNGGTYAYDAAKVHAVTSVTKTAGTTPQTLQNITYTKFNKADLITQYTTTTPTKTQTYAITYGPDEQRVKTFYTDTVGSKIIRFYAGDYEKDSIVVGTTKTTKKIHYITGGTGLVAVYIKWSTGQDSMFYVCKDRQGSITALLKQNGQVSERYSYDAWGRRRNPANWNDYNVKAPRLVSRGYTGHEMLDGFGLINMNGRMYDPVIGRILSPDPFVSSPTNTQSFNRYSYCLNNPLRYNDPSGYNEHPADWGMEPYFPLAGYDTPWVYGAVGPGSGNHWSDPFRDMYSNLMLMSSTDFMNRYDISAYSYYNVYLPNINTLRQGNFYRNSRGELGFYGESTSSWDAQKIGHDQNGNMTGYIPGEVTSQWVRVSNAPLAQPQGQGANFNNSSLALDIGGGIYGGLRTAVTPGDQWLGTNGKYYNNSWGGNRYTGSRSGAFAASNTYKWAGRATVGVTVVIGSIQVYNGYQMDGGQFGYNANLAGASATGSIAGGLAGAKAGASIGFAIGVWIGGVGAVPCTIIGGFIGGIAGSLAGNKVGEISVNYYYGR